GAASGVSPRAEATIAAGHADPPAASSTPATPAPPATPRVVTDWCVEGLAALDEETCYVLPEAGDGGGAAPLVSLHGIVPPVPASPEKERVQLAVLHAAKRAHAAALVPRGLRGVGPSGARDWWAWPTEVGAHAKHAAASTSTRRSPSGARRP